MGARFGFFALLFRALGDRRSLSVIASAATIWRDVARMKSSSATLVMLEARKMANTPDAIVTMIIRIKLYALA